MFIHYDVQENRALESASPSSIEDDAVDDTNIDMQVRGVVYIAI